MICIDKFAEKLSHNDLIVIEDCLLSQKKHLLSEYSKISIELDSLGVGSAIVDKSIADLMKRLCVIYDSILRINSVLDVYKDVRLDDFLNKDYRL